jgi:putative Mn2+ efflux pump MntP
MCYRAFMLNVVLIGLSLSLDAFAVSVSSGIAIRELRKGHMIRASLFFGLFQFFMPVSGWLLGNTFVSYMRSFDHWIAFILLAFIGGKMVLEGLPRRKRENKPKPGTDIRRLKTLTLLAIATSIDAFAAGISFSLIGQDIFLAAATIGIITFAVCLAGFLIGKRVGLVLQKGAQLAGGVVLIAIGARILLEHLLERS